ncbi:MAG: prepilin-type N-terminal cleavage/methylation domain-containing protein [Thermodesulfobacteriota bacterium]|nr:prepilin-type N-terminal cleavage/methylation domain-containing protein [Thermodesulfobacteriota bacterium]
MRDEKKPVKNATCFFILRKSKRSTPGIQSVFRGLKCKSDAEIGQKRGGVKCTEKGLTLIELLVVVSVILVLTVLAYPNLLSRISYYRLNGAVNMVVSDCQLARIKSISNAADYRIDFDTANNRYDLVREGTPDVTEQDDVPLPRGIIFGTYATQDTNNDGTAPPGDGVGFFPNPNNSAEFQPNASAKNGAIYLQIDQNLYPGNQRTLAITVANTGRVRTRHWNSSTSRWD